MKVLACVEFDASSSSCTTQAWVESPGVLPPFSVAQGLQVSGLMISIIAGAWALKAVRRYLNPRV